MNSKTKLFGLIIISTLLTACGGGSNSDSGASNKTPDQEQKQTSQASENSSSTPEATSQQPAESKASTKTSAKGTCTSYTKEQILEVVNKARSVGRNCGAKFFPATNPVTWNDSLALASKDHAEDIAKNEIFSHTGSDGSEPAERVTRNGYTYKSTAENIAFGHPTIDEAVQGWIDSPSHCVNLMGSKFEETGLMCVNNPKSKFKNYWVQNLGTKL